MTTLEKYELVNKCEDIDALVNAIGILTDELGYISGRTVGLKGNIMAVQARVYYKDGTNVRFLTRNYGIRQQAIYLREWKLQLEKII